MAASQSVPTANTHDPAPVPGIERSGAPLAALAVPVAPMPAALENAMTVSESWKLPADGVAVTFCAARVPLARAHQISASPDCALLRLASVHVRPAPLIVNVCLPAPAGPSDDTNATTRSLDPVGVKAGLDTTPEPSVEPPASMVTGPAG